MDRQVFLFDVEGQKALGFDTGLDSRAFARTKFAQFITEPGYTVSFDGKSSSVNLWKASGVVEYSEAEAAGSTMVIWGPPPPFRWERLDILLHDNDKREQALTAIRSWIQALLETGAPPAGAPTAGAPPLWPCAALIGEDQPGEIFFAPMDLTVNCLMAKESNKINNRYVHPDLNGMNAAAFTAAAMLYHVFAGSQAFPAADEIIRHEDMREGNFLPIRLAAPGLNDKLSALLQTALNQSVKKDGGLPNGTRLLEGFLALLQPAPLSSFVSPLSEADKLLIEKEKTQYLKTNSASVNTRRFVKRNAAVLLGSFAALIIAVLIVNSVIKSRSLLSTANMEPVEIIESYYKAFGKLDHQWMEACVIKGAGKDDISMVMNLFIISKVRQAYEYKVQSSFMSAQEWQESGGGQVELPVFGVTDLQIRKEGAALSGEELYKADYTLWVPGEALGGADMEQNSNDPARGYLPPKAFHRADLVTLVQKKGNWRISEIRRVSAE